MRAGANSIVVTRNTGKSASTRKFHRMLDLAKALRGIRAIVECDLKLPGLPRRKRLQFRGKSAQMHDIPVEDKRLARIIRECRDLPGYELFQYLDDFGEIHSVDSSDVNPDLHEAAGQDFTAKDFRTWAGTVLTALVLSECEPC
jgi:DNA topoisomerase IB